MEVKDTLFPDIKWISSFYAEDKRGSFTKVYNRDVFQKNGLRTDFCEMYYSVSSKNVIRGMHFQVPPFEHAKLVHVVQGTIDDVVVDLRADSPWYQKALCLRMTAEQPSALYIPKGFAHGFLSREDQTIVTYFVTSGYDAACDQGILWDSIDYDWGIENPIVSERDQSFPMMSEYCTPFGIAFQNERE